MIASTFRPAALILENNATFSGLSPTWQKQTFSGEVVFTTGMTGYVESLTDPSYQGQILVFTYPLIGNYGVPIKNKWESAKIHAAGVIVTEACEAWSHRQGKLSVLEWLKAQYVPIITGVDTRALTKMLRTVGTMPGTIISRPPRDPSLKGGGALTSSSFKRSPPAGGGWGLAKEKNSPVSAVSISRPKIYGHGKKKIIAVDCGMKENIIRCLVALGLTVIRVPYDYDYTPESYDAIFISNGPGDPTECTSTIDILKKALAQKKPKPIFGICLGSQLLALAAGATTYKLPYGHRGQNQPCLETATGKCVITSQNHGYAVDEKTIPPGWEVNYRNLNDGSVEGLAHKKLPFFSVQFHPEASPGPTDTRMLFDKFYRLM